MEPIQSAVVAVADQELRLRYSFGQDHPRLETTLTKSRILIDRAERWSFKDERLAQILTQLKDAAYDAEDVLDDIDYEDQQKKIQGQHSQVSQILRYPLNFAQWLMNSTPRRVRTIQERLDTIGADLEGLMDKLGLHGDYSMPANRQTGSVVGITTVYGRDEEREKVIELLGIQRGQGNNGTDVNESVSVPAKRRKKENVKKENVSVVSIYGIGGVGKTTLAQIVYNDQRVADHFDLKIWICVSDKFDVKSLSKEIIDNAGKGYETDDHMNLNSLQVILKEIAMAHRFLLILDDVWNEDTEKWDKFYMPLRYGKEGSMILVTTRSLKVASIAGTVDPILLEGLPGNVYREFFESCAFRRNNPKDYPELENIGISIAAKLKGSPLAAKTIGSLLNEGMDEGHWNTILNSELWELPQKEGDILPALRLSYQYLPPHLKRCFSFCSIFHKDYEINKNELASIWVALGLVIPQGNMLLENIANIYLGDLTSRCFFQQSHMDPLNYVMHDLIHDLAQFVSVDECFMIDKGDGQLRIPKTVRHLSICCADIGKNMLMELGSYHKLRSLIILYKLPAGLDSVIDSWFRSLSNICCLKLSFFDALMLPESISNLKHLRYLDVSGTSIRTLPESLCHLNNLQVLNVSNSWFECFPQGFTRLHYLRKLYAKEEIISKISEIYAKEERIFKISKRGGVTSLQCGPELEVRKYDSHKIGELKHMRQLGGSLCITKLENVGSTEDARQAKLDNKPYLDKLILEWSQIRSSNFDHDMEVLEGLQPHQKLKKLTIKHYGGTTSPSWLRPQTLNCLSELCIENCGNLNSLPLDSFEDFVSLKSMIIRDCPKLTCRGELILPPSINDVHLEKCGDLDRSLPGCLQNLKSLTILTIHYCQHITSLPGQVMCQLKSLEMLSIQSCEELSSLGGLDALASLIEIKICRCPKLADSEPPMFDFTDEVQRTKISLTIDRTTLLKLQSLRNLVPFITKLEIDDSIETEMFVGEDGELLGRFQSLELLVLSSCGKLKSLPAELHRLTSLQSLCITGCIEIHSLPENGLPASLNALDVSYCNRKFERQLKTYKLQKKLPIFSSIRLGG